MNLQSIPKEQAKKMFQEEQHSVIIFSDSSFGIGIQLMKPKTKHQIKKEAIKASILKRHQNKFLPWKVKVKLSIPT